MFTACSASSLLRGFLFLPRLFLLLPLLFTLSVFDLSLLRRSPYPRFSAFIRGCPCFCLCSSLYPSLIFFLSAVSLIPVFPRSSAAALAFAFALHFIRL